MYLDEISLFATKFAHYFLKDGTAVKIEMCKNVKSKIRILLPLGAGGKYEGRIQRASTVIALFLK